MTFNPTIYDDPEERAEARERYYSFDDEMAESEREFRHERERDRLSEIPNPIHRVVTVSGDAVGAFIEWAVTTEGTIYIETVTDYEGECLINHVAKGELSRIVEEINHFKSMSEEEMIYVPASVPKWRELMERHGIETIEALNMDTGNTRWEAHSESIPETFSTGETEREAVVALIHRLKKDEND